MESERRLKEMKEILEYLKETKRDVEELKKEMQFCHEALASAVKGILELRRLEVRRGRANGS